jgi:DNA-directed RNA polymerase subunit M/transcription elongation factor TFIIS
MDFIPLNPDEACPDCGGRLRCNGIAMVCARCPYCRPAQDSSQALPAVSNPRDYCPDCGGKLLFNSIAMVCSRCPYCRPAQDSSHSMPAIRPSKPDHHP